MTRNKAIQVLDNERKEYIIKGCQLDKAIDIAIEALTEPKTGEWIWSDEDASWKCGCCDCVFEEIDWKPDYNYCPNCGARMFKEDGEA